MSKNVHSEVSKDSPTANSIFGEIHSEEKATKCDMTSSAKYKEKLNRIFLTSQLATLLWVLLSPQS